RSPVAIRQELPTSVATYSAYIVVPCSGDSGPERTQRSMSMNEGHPEAEVPHGTLAEVGRDLASRPYARRGVPARIEPIRVMLVDDHQLVRAGLRSVLHGNADITVVGEAAGGEEAVALATRMHPEVMVM